MVATLTTERLILRDPRPSDAGLISLYASDERVAMMTAAIPHPYPPGAAEAFVAAQLAGKRSEELWVMDATPSGGEELIGVIGLKVENAEIGYWVGPPFWNTGYATEAIKAVLEHLFGARGLVQITAAVFEDNPVSAQVLLKTGFEETGTIELFSVARSETVVARAFCHKRGG